MPNYKTTVIYYIPTSKNLQDTFHKPYSNFYGYSPCFDAQKRLHRNRFRKMLDCPLHQALQNAGMTQNDMEFVIVELYPCENEEQAQARVQYWIDKKGGSIIEYHSCAKQQPSLPQEKEEKLLKAYLSVENGKVKLDIITNPTYFQKGNYRKHKRDYDKRLRMS